MAKFCSNCGKELNENASLCLNCGVLVDNKKSIKEDRKKGLPTWAIVLIVLGVLLIFPIIIVVILAVTTYSIITDTDINFEEYIEESFLQKGTIGDTLITDDFKITLTDAIMYDMIEDSETIPKPKDGKEYLVLFLDIENISDESEYISLYDFEGYVDKYSTSIKQLYNEIDNYEELNIKLSKGMKTKGYVAFEIDKTWQEFELHFIDSFDSDEKIVFTVINENTSHITGA